MFKVKVTYGRSYSFISKANSIEEVLSELKDGNSESSKYMNHYFGFIGNKAMSYAHRLEIEHVDS